MAMSQSSQYTPPRPSSCGEVAHHTLVAAPSATDLKPAGTLRAASIAAPISSGDKDRARSVSRIARNTDKQP